VNPAAWEPLMEEALDLARRGAGEVEPNPRVGALALENGRVVGRGWHAAWGGPHAEVAALAAAAAAGARPDTVVVTLEPCCSTGKTPPCTEALLAARIGTLVYGATDPDPRHQGRGPALLAAAGVEVLGGILAGRCLESLGPFRVRLSAPRPWLVGKWAMSLDGRIATRTGSSRWITSEPQRALAHRLRARCDGILVGLGTVLADDPELTVRLAPGRTPAAVVVDPGAEIPLDRKLVAGARGRPLYLLAEQGRADPARIDRLAAAGARVALFPAPLDLGEALAWLKAHAGMARMVCEGGGRLLGSLHDLGLLDQVEVHLGMLLIGGTDALAPLGGCGAEEIGSALRLELLRVEEAGGGLRVVAVPR